MTRSAIFVAIVVLIAAPSGAQNLLTNPGFDVPDQLNGWTCRTTYGTSVWSPHDHLGSPGSGSMENEVSATSDNQSVRCSQCVPVHQHLAYAASVWCFWPDDPDVSQQGSTRISFQFYSDADCIDVIPVGEVQSTYPTLDTWLHLVSDEVDAPAGAMSAGVFVFTWQTLANQPVRARVDDVEFSTTALFWDDFESGGLDAWSDSTP